MDHPTTPSNLLIVDNDATVRGLLGQLLACLSPQPRVFTATNTQEALQICGSNPIDLVTTDLIRDDGDSGELLLKVMRDRYPSIPVIVITGGNGASTDIETLGMGAKAYFTKPFNIHGLFALVAAMTHTEIPRRL